MDSKNRMTDDALVKAYIGGDAEAFDCLLARYQDRLFQHIFYAVHDEDLANDIFQETFVKVILSLRKGNYVEQGQFSLGFRESPTTWCLIISKHSADSAVMTKMVRNLPTKPRRSWLVWDEKRK